MSFFRYKKNLNPIIAFVTSLFLIVFGLVFARELKCSYFLIGVYVWLFLFGCWRGCLRILPAMLIVGGLFAGIAYLAYGNDWSAALAMFNRFGTVFLAVAVSMSVQSVAITRSLSQIHTPRAVTLGMLIATSFVPVLRAEIKRVREAMKTRGAGSVFNPKIFYRALLVPFVLRLVNISDTLSLSVETRGFTLGKAPYTIYKKEEFVLSDLIFLLGIAAAAVMVVVL